MRLCALAVLVAFALIACGGDNVLHTCDIRESSCQFDVFLAVQDVRGSVWDPWLEPPPMRVISDVQYRDEVIAEHERMLQEQGVDYLTPALKLLHMIDPNELPGAATDFQVAKVAAYYDPVVKRVTIIDLNDQTEPSQRDAVQRLAHELVHAAQDRDIGFGRLYQDVVSADSTNAMSLLVEGEAVAYAYLVNAKQLDIPKGAIDWSVFSKWAGDERTKAFDDPSPYRIATTQFAYPLGATYISQAYLGGGPLAVRRIFDHPPLSASRFMAGLGALEDHTMPAWTCNTPPPPTGFQLRLADELGAFSMYALATRITVAEEDAWLRAQHWTGDRFYIYSDPNNDAALVVVWLLRFDDLLTAEGFQASLARMPWATGIQTMLDGDKLHVLASSTALDPSFVAWSQCLPL